MKEEVFEEVERLLIKDAKEKGRKWYKVGDHYFLFEVNSSVTEDAMEKTGLKEDMLNIFSDWLEKNPRRGIK